MNAARLAAVTGLFAWWTCIGLGCSSDNGNGSKPADEASLRFPGANLMLISIDTLRADHLQAYGYLRATSPGLQDWLAEAILFEQAYSQAPKTATSHMTLMTGRSPGVHGVRNWWQGVANPLPPGIPTLASELSRSGYRCAGFTGGGNVSGALGFARGFEIYEDAGRDRLSQIYQWVEDAQRDGPFFLFFHTFEVHDPYIPPIPYDDEFDPLYDGPLRFRRTVEEASLHGTNFGLHDDFWSRFRVDDPRERSRLIALYDGEIRYTDKLIFDLIDRIEAMDLEQDLLVVFTSDHGEELFDRGSTLHNTLHAEVLHVPLIIRLPGRRFGGLRIQEPVRLLDVFPTLLDLLEITPSHPIDGRSLLPTMVGRRRRDVPIFAEWKNPRRDMVSVREGKWKLIWDRQENRVSLYDVEKDPREKRDLSSANHTIVEQMRRRIEALEKSQRELNEGLPQSEPLSATDAETRRLLELGYIESSNPGGSKGNGGE